MKFRQCEALHDCSSREKPSRDENGPDLSSLETSNERFPLLHTSPTWYPGWITSSPPSTVFQCYSWRMYVVKPPPSNLQESPSPPEQGTNFRASTTHKPQKHGVILVLHHRRGVKEGARGSLPMLQKYPRKYFPSEPVLQWKPLFLATFWLS